MVYTINLQEKALSSKERNKLDNSEFGIPEERKYPLNDEAHVRAAVKFFNKVEPKYEESLARRIIKRIKELNLDIQVGEDNKLSKYYKSPKKESTVLVKASSNPIDLEKYKSEKELEDDLEYGNLLKYFNESGSYKAPYFINDSLYKEYVDKLKEEITKVFNKTVNKYPVIKKYDLFISYNSINDLTSFGGRYITDNELFIALYNYDSVKENDLYNKYEDLDKRVNSFVEEVCDEITKLGYGTAKSHHEDNDIIIYLRGTLSAKKLKNFKALYDI